MRCKLSTILSLLTMLSMLFILAPCAYSDDHGDDCNSATSVSCNSTTSGDIETEGDWDFFRIDLTGYGVLTIYSTATGDWDCYGYLYDSGCNEITKDDDSGSGLNFRMVESLSAGTYYVAVKLTGYQGTTGSYTLDVEFESECSDPSSVPLSAVKRAAPANIMFVLDDSGSMDAEILTEGEVYGNDSTRVTISGWNTGPDNYIKIYTPTSLSEVGTSQRHDGKWDIGKYCMSVNLSGSNLSGIRIREDFVRIEGLQIYFNGSGSDIDGIFCDCNYIQADSDIRISHNIIRSANNVPTWASGVGVWAVNSGGNSAKVRIWNNIIYDIDGDSNVGIITGWQCAPTAYVYNNTIYGCYWGILRDSEGSLIAKNNIAYNNYDNYDGTFDGSSTNNLSGPSQSDAPGSNGRNAKTVTFVNAAGHDFHLDSPDAGAKGYGADLSADPYLPFSDDIDIQTRESGSWDIGADECYTGAETWYTITASGGTGGSIAPSGAVSVTEGANQGFTITEDTGYVISDVVVDGSSVGAVATYTFTNVTADHTISALFQGSGAATTLYRSAGTNPSNLNTDNRTVTISGSTATFSGSMPNNVGVGDVLTYSSGGNRLAFIHGRTSSTVFTVRDKDGNEPTDASAGTAVSVYRSYTSLANWESQTENPNITEPTENDVNPSRDLVSAGTVVMVACYGDANDYLYVFDDPGDHIFEERILGSTRRSFWKYQWSGYNKMYYDPTVTYEPWPGRTDADADTPRSHPYFDDNYFNLNGTYINTLGVNIKNAHYYTFDDTNGNGDYDSGEPVYLVVIDGVNPTYTLNYYLATISGGGATEEVTNLVTAASVPESVKSGRSAAEERQNFANWYSFYRRRHFTATAAVANTIDSMQGVNVGLYSINSIYGERLKQPVLPVKVKGIDNTATLLNSLYSMTLTSDMSKPLRRGLEAVGRYYDKKDGVDTGGIGESPYSTQEEGGACQQAFAVVVTDGSWNGSDPSVDNADGDNNTDFDCSPGEDCLYGDTYSNTLADVAMDYYERDLVSDSDLPDLVPTNLSDSNARQHMVTYTVAFGISGTLNPADYDLESGSYPTWPDPFNTSDPNYNKHRIDDLWHAAVNGRGEYLSVFNSSELADSLMAIKESIEARTGSAAPVSVNGVELYEELGSELYMFQSTYNTNGWTGDVKAYRVDPVTGELSETPEWSAADKLDAMLLSNRKIATYNPDTATGIPFQYTESTSTLTDTQKGQLNSDWTIAAFLRGNRSLEGSTFRTRFSILGDIVHSSPVYENGVLYTGANDGMMHAFSATDGSEIFAYVPNLVFENLAGLASPEYYDNHTFYVDLSPAIQRRVEISSENEITLLVGGLGRGGKGYYALNITGIDETAPFSSDADVAAKVMWEFGGDDDLGYTYARPSIVGSNQGCPYGAEDCEPYWIVIAGNGYNSASGDAVLIILSASDGTELTRIDTGVGSCNGLSTPVAIDVNYDDKVDYVYAGDLKGNLWKFDLTSADYNDWTVAYKDGVGNPQPLFQALGQPITTKPDVMRHPTRHGYIVVFGTGKYLGASDLEDTSLNTIYGIWDYGDDSDDSEYLGAFNRESSTRLSNQLENVTLREQQCVPSSTSDPNYPDWTLAFGSEEVVVRILTDNDPNWETVDDTDTDQLANPGSNADPPNTVHAGWYFDLPLTGERVVSDVMIREGKAIVITFTPEEAACSIGGDSIIHEMDAATGGRLPTPQLDLDSDAVIGSSDLVDIGGGLKVAPTGIQKTGRLHVPAILRMGTTEMKYLSSSEGTIKTVREVPARLGVRYWRELE